MDPKACAHLFARGIEIAGGRGKLAERLHATPGDIDRWAAGEGQATAEVFLRLAEIFKQELLKTHENLIP